MLSADVGPARQMMRSLLDGRMMFMPDLDAETCSFIGRGHLDGLLTGLIDPAALLVPWQWRPQRDSNPCLGLERATSWASGRWGRSEGWSVLAILARHLRGL